MSARHLLPRTAKEHAENAAEQSDLAARIFSDADGVSQRDRDDAMLHLALAVTSLSLAVGRLSEDGKL